VIRNNMTDRLFLVVLGERMFVSRGVWYDARGVRMCAPCSPGNVIACLCLQLESPLA